MGIIRIEVRGSFREKNEDKVFTAKEFGHAHAVADAIDYLSQLLPWAIAQDHWLHEKQTYPMSGTFQGKPRRDR